MFLHNSGAAGSKNTRLFLAFQRHAPPAVVPLIMLTAETDAIILLLRSKLNAAIVPLSRGEKAQKQRLRFGAR